VRSLQRGDPNRVGVVRVTEVHVGGSMKPDPDMPMPMIIEIDEAGHECPRLIQRSEPLRELRSILARLEPRLGIRIVIRHVRTGTRLQDLQIRQQRRHRFAGHRTTTVGMDCELAIYLAASLHAKWHGFQTPVRVQGVRAVGRSNKSPIPAR